MKLIDNLTEDPTQQVSVVLDDGTILALTITYRPANQRWVATLSNGTWEVDGLNLCVSPNCLRGWRNLIDFGLMCVTNDGLDPFLIDDWVSGRAQLYTLSAADVASLETSIFATGAAPS